MSARSAISKLLLLAAGVALIAAALRFGPATDRHAGHEPQRLSAALPAPDETPHAVIEAAGGEFPLAIARGILDSASELPGGRPSFSALLPIIAGAEESVSVIMARGASLFLYGAFGLTADELAATDEGRLPPRWDACLTRGALIPSGSEPGRFELRADEFAEPVYIEIDRASGAARAADSSLDMERMREAAEGRLPVVRPERDNDGWGGRAHFNGGDNLRKIFAGMMGVPPGELGTAPLTAEFRWRHEPRGVRTLASTAAAGTVEWTMRGAGQMFGDTFIASLTPCDWSGFDLFVPDPPLFSFGVNLPDPGSRIDDLPLPLRLAAKQLSGMGLRNSETRAMLTGPSTFSLGGRTQVLWFDLPGLAIDLRGRGAAGRAFVERFWAEAFFGAEPAPADGFKYGGGVTMPFTATAASDGDTVIAGLAAPDAERFASLAEALAKADRCVAWFYGDMPKLAGAITEMPTLGALLYGDDGPAEDAEPEITPSPGLLDAMKSLGRFFAAIETPERGRIVWFD